eukprot:2896426-Rhodomonas_salina.1
MEEEGGAAGAAGVGGRGEDEEELLKAGRELLERLPEEEAVALLQSLRASQSPIASKVQTLLWAEVSEGGAESEERSEEGSGRREEEEERELRELVDSGRVSSPPPPPALPAGREGGGAEAEEQCIRGAERVAAARAQGGRGGHS